MGEPFKELAKRSMIMFILPLVTCLIGYHSLLVEGEVLDKVKTEYVSKAQLTAVVQNIDAHSKDIDKHTLEIKQLAITSHQNELTIREISTNLKYITDLLNELKNDVRRIGAKPNEGN